MAYVFVIYKNYTIQKNVLEIIKKVKVGGIYENKSDVFHKITVFPYTQVYF